MEAEKISADLSQKMSNMRVVATKTRRSRVNIAKKFVSHLQQLRHQRQSSSSGVSEAGQTDELVAHLQQLQLDLKERMLEV